MSGEGVGSLLLGVVDGEIVDGIEAGVDEFLLPIEDMSDGCWVDTGCPGPCTML